MQFLRNPLSLGVMIAAIVGLAFVIVASLVFVVAYRRREKLSWSSGMRAAFGVGGTLMAGFVLMLPTLIGWAKYFYSTSSMEHDLTLAAPEVRASLVARAVDGTVTTALAADISTVLLVVPCAVLAGLALTVPFFLTRAPGGES